MHLTVKRYFDDTFAILDRNSVDIVCSLCSRRLSVIVWGARQSRAGARRGKRTALSSSPRVRVTLHYGAHQSRALYYSNACYQSYPFYNLSSREG